jgi:hypothetical protein
MAFADPQSITVNGVPKSMPRVLNDGKKSIYSNADGTYTMTISHAQQKDKIRTVVRVDQRKVVADPLTTENDYQTLTTMHIVERPVYGFSATELEHQLLALEGWQDATNIGKLYGQES